MAKQAHITVKGRVIEGRPNGMFSVLLENGHEVLAHISGKIRINQIEILPNDIVHVSLSPYDLNRGILTFREKTPR